VRKRLTLRQAPSQLAVPSSPPTAVVDAFEVLLQPIVVEGERTDQVGRGREGDEADTIVRPFLDELRHDGLTTLDAVHAPAVDLKSSACHRPETSSPSTMSSRGGHLGAAMAALRARQPDDHEAAARRGKQPDPPACPGAALRRPRGKAHIPRISRPRRDRAGRAAA